MDGALGFNTFEKQDKVLVGLNGGMDAAVTVRILQEQGFAVVEHVAVTEENILSAIEDFEHKIEHYDIPSDGLVLTYESISYGQSLGRTAKFPRDSIAFKWADELRETTLKEVEWSQPYRSDQSGSYF